MGQRIRLIVSMIGAYGRGPVHIRRHSAARARASVGIGAIAPTRLEGAAQALLAPSSCAEAHSRPGESREIPHLCGIFRSPSAQLSGLLPFRGVFSGGAIAL